MISVKNLKKSFQGTEVLKGINVEIDKGDVICVIGPSGSDLFALFKPFRAAERRSYHL